MTATMARNISGRVHKGRRLLAACEEYYINGFSCQQTGSVDWHGHFYRIGRRIVRTDQQGFRFLLIYKTTNDARIVMDLLDEEYSAWMTEGGE